MNILALDTATQILSVALAAKGGTWYFEVDAGHRHSELLMSTISTLLKIAGVSPKDLDLVACMKGPGSFTGLRIGFAAAKGLCLSLGIPMATVPTLDCMAYPFGTWCGSVLPLIDAKKHSYFCALYQQGKRISADMDMDIDKIAEMIAGTGSVLLTGPDADIFVPELSKRTQTELCLDICHRKGVGKALLSLAPSNIDTAALFSGPEYIRKSDAELDLETKNFGVNAPVSDFLFHQP
jgi:tRNA threonylcarbamoyladenosine biosynthesis protein TsaB